MVKFIMLFHEELVCQVRRVACRLITRLHDLEGSERRLLELQGRAPPVPLVTHDAEQQTAGSLRSGYSQEAEAAPLSADEAEQEESTARSEVQEDAERIGRQQYASRSGEQGYTPRSGEDDYSQRSGEPDESPRSGEQDDTPRSGEDKQTPRSGEEDYTPQSSRSYEDPEPPSSVGVIRVLSHNCFMVIAVRLLSEG